MSVRSREERRDRDSRTSGPRRYDEEDHRERWSDTRRSGRESGGRLTERHSADRSSYTDHEEYHNLEPRGFSEYNPRHTVQREQQDALGRRNEY